MIRSNANKERKFAKREREKTVSEWVKLNRLNPGKRHTTCHHYFPFRRFVVVLPVQVGDSYVRPFIDHVTVCLCVLCDCYIPITSTTTTIRLRRHTESLFRSFILFFIFFFIGRSSGAGCTCTYIQYAHTLTLTLAYGEVVEITNKTINSMRRRRQR